MINDLKKSCTRYARLMGKKVLSSSRLDKIADTTTPKNILLLKQAFGANP
jgi:hypothetical protein